MLRGFGLNLFPENILSIDNTMPRESTAIINSLSQSFALTSTDIASLSKLIVSMIGSGKNRDLCMEYIIKMFKILRSYYYPSNSGVWMVFLKFFR